MDPDRDREELVKVLGHMSDRCLRLAESVQDGGAGADALAHQLWSLAGRARALLRSAIFDVRNGGPSLPHRLGDREGVDDGPD